ncbi:MAG: PEP-CTERM sorting domain-containing protein [Pirellulales bacterium]|nr:PEP-CTERM sorting domain-containing protein [Pirellulales bacterium]
MRLTYHVIIIVSILLSLQSVANADVQIWNAADDFARPGIPNGNRGWTQGEVDTGGVFHAYTTSQWLNPEETICRWYTLALPDALCNVSANDIYIDGGTLLVAPNTVTVHPGSGGAGTSGWDNDLRWTAPTEGNYLVDTLMYGATTINTNAIAYVLKNLDYNSPLAQAAIDGFVNTGGTTLTYGDTLHLLAGDTLDFVVNIGAVEQPDNVGIRVTITQVPEPSSGILMVAGLVGLIAHLRRKRNTPL